MRTILDTLYAALPSATELPQGTYDGEAWPVPLFLTTEAWKGKRFAGERVVNRMGDDEWIHGTVTLADTGEVRIYYQSLNLYDYLKPVGSHAWLGWTQPRRAKIWFVLTKTKEQDDHR